MRKDILKIEGLEWLEIRYAAQLCRIRADELRAMIAAGKLRSLEFDGDLWITKPATLRLKRENAVIIGARQAQKNIGKLPPQNLSQSTRGSISPGQVPLDLTPPESLPKTRWAVDAFRQGVGRK